MSDPVLSMRELYVDFPSQTDWTTVVHGVSFDVCPGEIVAVVGESGSGKTVSALSVLHLLPGQARIRGTLELSGHDLVGADAEYVRSVRGDEVGMVFQESMTALNPVHPVGRQITEALRAHRSVSRTVAWQRTIELLELVGVPEPERRARAYPRQLSGGQRQRAMIAMAICCDPKVLIADEPTTALDVTVQAEILDLLRDLRDRQSTGIVLITHDMGVVADVADRVVVMRDGRVVEQAPVDQLFATPAEEYTQQLLHAVPYLGAATLQGSAEDETQRCSTPALRLQEVVVNYAGGWRRSGVRAVDGVSFSIGEGEVLGLVGESGSGKSTIGRAVLGLLRANSGTVEVDGHDITQLSGRRLRPVRRQVGIVFQDPGSSLNPRASIGDSIAEPLLLGRVVRRQQVAERVGDLLDAVGLPTAWRDRYPHELSGGQRQRVGIARAVAVEPRLLVADEPTSALDVSVQARVLDLLHELQQRLGFACLFISHDLAVVEMLADRIVVLSGGQVVEQGDRRQVLAEPREGYTRALVAAAPVPNPAEQRRRRDERRTVLGVA